MVRLHEVSRLNQIAPHVEGDESADGPDDKRDAPAPGLKLGRCQQQKLQDHEHCNCKQLPEDQRDILKARIETAPAARGHFTQISCARTVLSTKAEPLEQTGAEKNDGRCYSDRTVA